MIERIVGIKLSKRKGKKYVATVQSKEGRQRNIHFGARGYEQYKDSTRLRSFSSKDHNSRERRRRYFLRHSGVPDKRSALKKEIKRSRGKYNAKILSHIYLW